MWGNFIIPGSLQSEAWCHILRWNTCIREGLLSPVCTLHWRTPVRVKESLRWCSNCLGMKWLQTYCHGFCLFSKCSTKDRFWAVLCPLLSFMVCSVAVMRQEQWGELQYYLIVFGLNYSAPTWLPAVVFWEVSDLHANWLQNIYLSSAFHRHSITAGNVIVLMWKTLNLTNVVVCLIAHV